MTLCSCVLVLSVAAGCGAPSAERAQGGVAKAVETALASGTGRFDHTAWGRLLEEGTRGGLVDYRFMQAHRSDLDAYLAASSAARLDRLAPGQLEAFLINVYNALTVRSILDHPNVASIREIKGVWTGARHPVGGFSLTLDEIEHRILRPFFRDPRVHFALNCASRSCAPLPSWAYDGDRIDTQLEERAESFLSDPANVRVDGSKLVVSKYFDWYGEDFTPTVAAYVARYAREDVRGWIESRRGRVAVGYLNYDWSLNAVVPSDGATKR